MQQNNTQQKKPQQKNKLPKLFFKTFIITLLAVVVIFGAGWLTLRSTSKPPVIDVSGEDLGNPAASEKDKNLSSSALDGNPEDESAEGNEKQTVSMATPPERKPLFYTFLVFGEDNNLQTDTIMVGAYDGTAKKAYLISIPRDTKVNVKRSLKKINGAYATGFVGDGGHEGGVNQLRHEVRTLIGFVPDFYVYVNFDAFTDIVDAVGGVEVNVPYLMDYRDSAQDLRIYFTEGLHTLSGDEALAFARHRQNNDENENTTTTYTDYQRIANQQQVISAVAEKVLQPSNIIKVPEFISIFNEHVKTDLKPMEISWFAEELLAVKDKPNAVEAFTLPIAGSTYPNGSYELADEAKIIELVNKTVNPYLEEITAEDVDIAGE